MSIFKGIKTLMSYTGMSTFIKKTILQINDNHLNTEKWKMKSFAAGVCKLELNFQ